ncbi:potassium voltage-gated channel subfamily A member 2 [Nematostella vectensis]|uniref:potassium voltage-gated channel subfamily A member 2 n=1 Tax=Nematostella vectensis TaxID=45351 RepID=UPI00207725EB|nr:potassium voltage-gated channel subfamily A member 2 [Nematostella vectensis]XP_032232781.2 potassium voltage-gated channel subfamily A member 2 [Nematostella vectensis]
MLKSIGLAPSARFRKPQFYSKNDLPYTREIAAYRRPRVTINVSGMRYETHEETLSNYPETLLGSPERRRTHYDETTDEYYFERDKQLFDAILFYYQSRGILAKPEGVEEEVFMREVQFWGLQEKPEEAKEGNEVVLPECPFKRRFWLWFEYPRSSRIAKGLALWSVFIITLSTVSFCVETLPQFQHDKIEKIRHATSHAHNKTLLQRVNVTKGNTTVEVLVNKTIRGESTTWSTEIVDHYFTDYWFVIEAYCVAWFTVEFVVRMWASPCTWLFVKSWFGVLDVVAIVPFYITLALKESTYDVRSFAVIRALRLFRVIRIFKLSRYSDALKLLVKTLYSSSEQLRSLLFCFLVAIILFSSIIYYVDDKDNIPSIPHAFWWSVITMTSVGYGDVVPSTIAGKLVGSLCAMSGLILFCLPTPVLVSNFIKYYLVAGATDQRKKIFAENLKELFLRKLKD